MSFYWIYDIPNWQLGMLFCGVSCVVTCACVLLTRPMVRRWLGPEPASNDMVSYFMSAFGVFYGLMLGLIAVGTYENFADADADVGREVAALGALYRDVSNLPDPGRTELRILLRKLCKFIIEEAWPSQRKGEINEEGASIIDAFEERLVALEPPNRAISNLHVETLRQLNVYLELRRMRVDSVTSGLPPTLWYVVILGAVGNLLLCLLFSVDRLALHLTLAGILAFFIGLVIFLIAAMDNPYRGEFSVSPESFETLLRGTMKATG